MIVESDSLLGVILAAMVFVSGIILLLASFSLLLTGQLRRAGAGILVAIVCIGVYMSGVMAVSILSPQRIVSIGDSYCSGTWCIGVESVNSRPQGDQVVYQVDVRIFKGPKSRETAAKGVTLYLLDDRGRRFSAAPFDVTLKPGQTVRTSLTFLTAADAKNLFLTGKADALQPPFWSRLYFGSDDSLLHKPTLLRVL